MEKNLIPLKLIREKRIASGDLDGVVKLAQENLMVSPTM